ncbi:beta-1,3-galactosyl-O-glycosyl-glycoprotein beta-1,6-N-acetylglucosaminyltransferase-like [Ptychodera flava]|uniref:beta-1,3-galactosyl-O-glycosyl-glycoprotein beta-1,6-N-acetylglucosaminyltransferase-like n=1 Tax=Ptychodera flava TaxID=63121 RepID=UPI003969E4CF
MDNSRFSVTMATPRKQRRNSDNVQESSTAATKLRRRSKIIIVFLLLAGTIQILYISSNLQVHFNVRKSLPWSSVREEASDGNDFGMLDAWPGKVADIDDDERVAEKMIAKLQKKRLDYGMNFTCRALLTWKIEDLMLTFKTGKIQRFSQRHIIEDQEYHEMTLDCIKFRKEGGYYSKPRSRLEAEFPIAYSILMYKSVQQVEQLLRTIYMPQNSYCIHVDAKSPQETIKAMKYIAGCFDNVFVSSKLETVSHCTYSVLQAELNCMSDLLKRRRSWKYYINLCGQDFPLKTNLEIVKTLQSLNGQNDIHSVKNPHQGRQIYEYTMKRGDIFRKLPLRFKNPAPGNLTIYKGEFHVTMTRDFVDFAIKDNRAKALQQWLSDTVCPDEHYFSTLDRIEDAPGGYRFDTKEDVTREKLWRKRSNSGEIECYGVYVRDICIFTVRDLPRIVHQPQLFANKFHIDFDALAIDCLEEILRDRTENPTNIDLSFAANMQHVKWKKSLINKWLS